MSYYTRDKLSIKSNKLLANLLCEQILLSQKIQTFRQLISSIPYFDCIQLFRLLDRDQKGYLNQKDFQQLVGSKHRKVVMYVFSWFDQTKIGQISRLEFISFLVSRANSQLREIVARRIQQPQTNSQITITQQVRAFTQMLTQMISHQLRIIQQRKLLLQSDNYSIKGVLNSIDINLHEFVSVKDIYKFLQNYAIDATYQQIKHFLEIVDIKLDGKINIQQLEWIVQGFQNNNKDYLKRIHAANHKNIRTSHRTQNNQINSIQNSPLKQQNRINKSNSNFKSQVKPNINNQNRQMQPTKNTNFESQNINLSKKQVRSLKIQKNSKLIDENNELMNKSNKPIQDSKFQKILQKFKKAQKQSQQKQAQLIKKQLQTSSKLREQYKAVSISRNKALSELNNIYIPSNFPSNVRSNVPSQQYKYSSSAYKQPKQPTQIYKNYEYSYDRSNHADKSNVRSFLYEDKNNIVSPYVSSNRSNYYLEKDLQYQRQKDLLRQKLDIQHKYAHKDFQRRTFLEDDINQIKPFSYAPFNKQQIKSKLANNIYVDNYARDYPKRSHIPSTYVKQLDKHSQKINYTQKKVSRQKQDYISKQTNEQRQNYTSKKTGQSKPYQKSSKQIELSLQKRSPAYESQVKADNKEYRYLVSTPNIGIIKNSAMIKSNNLSTQARHPQTTYKSALISNQIQRRL